MQSRCLHAVSSRKGPLIQSKWKRQSIPRLLKSSVSLPPQYIALIHIVNHQLLDLSNLVWRTVFEL